MAETKTKPTGASVDEYIAARANPQQLPDIKALKQMLRRVTGKTPHMWGPSIVGYDKYRYTYDTGHSGEAPVAGFAIRGRDLVLYLMADSAEQQARLQRLGKHRMGKSCLYIRKLEDVDTTVLEELVAASVAEVRERWG